VEEKEDADEADDYSFDDQVARERVYGLVDKPGAVASRNDLDSRRQGRSQLAHNRKARHRTARTTFRNVCK
jgi:hypothetical protein